jgi:hypothetical protein
VCVGVVIVAVAVAGSIAVAASVVAVGVVVAVALNGRFRRFNAIEDCCAVKGSAN